MVGEKRRRKEDRRGEKENNKKVRKKGEMREGEMKKREKYIIYRTCSPENREGRHKTVSSDRNRQRVTTTTAGSTMLLLEKTAV